MRGTQLQLDNRKLVNTLDKEEFRIKLEQINSLVEKKDYEGALEVVDSIDWRKVKSARTLSIVGEIYAANKRYEESKEIFLLAYHRAGIGKNILYRLIEISLKMGNVEEAEEFFKEYKEIASNDHAKYVLEYKILRAKKAPLEEQIQVLEQYKEKEFTERWSYELAKLYYKAGEKEKCIDLCDTMVLWFSDGKYVMKALDLKMRMGVLTGEEKKRYEEQFIPKLITPEDVALLRENMDEEDLEDDEEEEDQEAENDTSQIGSIKIAKPAEASEEDGKGNIQDKIVKGIKDIFGKKKDENEEALAGYDPDDDDAASQMNIKRREQEAEEEMFGEIPPLEPENLRPEQAVPGAEENTEEASVQTQEEISEEEPEKFVFKQPKLMDIPPSMRTSSLPDPELVKQILEERKQKEAAADQEEKPVEETVEEEPVMERANFDFALNLEETILAAASAQGIQFGDQKENKEETEDFVSEAPEEFEEASEDIQEEESEFVSDPGEEINPILEEKTPEELSMERIQQEVERTAEFFKESTVVEKQEPVAVEELEEEPKPLMTEGLVDTGEAEEISPFEEAPLEEDNPEFKKFSEQLQKILEEDQKEKTPLTEEEKLESFIDSMNPEPEIDPTDIIPRDRKLTQEEEQLFTYFVKVPGMKEQLVEMLCDMQESASDKTSRTGNIIVMGARETGKTRLISSIIPAICKELHMEASKVAYVFAEQINGKDIAKIIKKMSGGFLVIENANQMIPETADELNRAMEFRTDGLTVILEDEKIGMRKFIAKYPKLAKKFTSMINIPVFTNDELVNFAKIYTKEIGYSIEQMGLLALYNMISQNQKEDEPMTIGGVKNLVDNAIAKSQGGMRKFKRNLSKKRLDRDGLIILYERDFT